jgi:transcription termination factor NusB
MRQRVKIICSILLICSVTGQVLAQNNNETGDSIVYKELAAIYGVDLDSLKKNSQAQQAMLDKFVSDYDQDRKQLARIFESITDRLDKIEGNLQGLDERIGELTKERK